MTIHLRKPSILLSNDKKKPAILLPAKKKVRSLEEFSPLNVTYHRKAAKPNLDNKLGSKAGSDSLHNCYTCSRFSVCKDANKNFNYRCTRYKENVIEPTSLEELFKSGESVMTEDEISYNEKEEDSIVDMISKVINSNIPVPPDLRINDEEIPQAKNFYDWVMKDKLGKEDTPPFPRQLEIGLKIFNEVCPRCSDSEWFDDMKVDAPLTEIRSKIQPLVFGVCPKCKGTKSNFIHDGELSNFFGIIGLVGQRGSKTSSMIMWDGYNLHKTLKLPSPQSVFGVRQTQVLSSTYTALTFQQAVNNIWNPYLNTLRTVPWFVNYHKFLTRRGEELGEELYNMGEHMVRYRHRNLVLAPSGPSKRVMRGQTRLSSATDEIGWFPMFRRSGGKKNPGDEDAMERLDAKGVFTALNNSLLTLKAAYRQRIEEGYNNLPKPFMYVISSPSQYNDFIMSAYRTYQNSTEFYAMKYATWDFNPKLKKKDFAEDFRTKPVEAARDYECNPPIGESLFITEHSSIIKAFRSGQNKISVQTKSSLSKTKSAITTASMQITTNNFPLRGTVLSIDIGISNNSLSFAVVGIPDDYDEEILPEDRGTLQTPVKVWALGEVIPKADTRISLTSVYTECFVPLIEAFNVKYVVSDRWQHAKITQDMENSYEVIPIEHKCTWGDFDAMRELLHSGNLILPRLTTPFDEIIKTTFDNYPECFRGRPLDHLAWQFATVRESTNVTVLKGDGGTDDSFRTIVLGTAMVQDPEILEELLLVNNGKAIIQPTHSVVVKYSGGAKVSSTRGAVTGQGGSALVMTKRLGR